MTKWNLFRLFDNWISNYANQKVRLDSYRPAGVLAPAPVVEGCWFLVVLVTVLKVRSSTFSKITMRFCFASQDNFKPTFATVTSAVTLYTPHPTVHLDLLALHSIFYTRRWAFQKCYHNFNFFFILQRQHSGNVANTHCKLCKIQISFFYITHCFTETMGTKSSTILGEWDIQSPE